jgi:hypothetical protein
LQGGGGATGGEGRR